MEELRKARLEKADQIIYLLDLFGGRLTFNDIMTCDLPILNQLQEAKIRRLEEQLQKTQEQSAKKTPKKKGGMI